MTTTLAIDMGSSSLRGYLGQWDGSALSLTEVYRAAHEVRRGEDDSLVWDVEELISHAVAAVEAGINEAGFLDAIAVDGWGVDYVQVDDKGNPVAPAYAYRDRRGQWGRAAFAERIDEDDQAALTGVACQDINTVYRLAWSNAHGALVPGATLMFLQDVVARALLTRPIAGLEQASDPGPWASLGVASTSGLVDIAHQGWEPKILQALDIDPAFYPPLRGECEIIGRRGSTAIVAAGSHDTACAVHSLALKPGDRFVSLGSWAIVGALADPVVDEGLTNEATARGGNRVQANLTGMWLAQECRRAWEKAGEDVSFSRLDREAAQAVSPGVLIDPSDPAFAAPGDMPRRIAKAVADRGGSTLEGIGPILRVVTESVAYAIAQALEMLAEQTGARGSVHVVGGGTKDALLMRTLDSHLDADLVVGASEASVLGSTFAQLEVLGVPRAALDDWCRRAHTLNNEKAEA